MRDLQFLLSQISTDLGDGHSLVNRPVSPFSDNVIAFRFDAAEDNFTSRISERFTKREGGVALDEGVERSYNIPKAIIETDEVKIRGIHDQSSCEGRESREP